MESEQTIPNMSYKKKVSRLSRNSQGTLYNEIVLQTQFLTEPSTDLEKQMCSLDKTPQLSKKSTKILKKRGRKPLKEKKVKLLKITKPSIPKSEKFHDFNDDNERKGAIDNTSPSIFTASNIQIYFNQHQANNLRNISQAMEEMGEKEIQHTRYAAPIESSSRNTICDMGTQFECEEDVKPKTCDISSQTLPMRTNTFESIGVQVDITAKVFPNTIVPQNVMNGNSGVFVPYNQLGKLAHQLSIDVDHLHALVQDASSSSLAIFKGESQGACECPLRWDIPENCSLTDDVDFVLGTPQPVRILNRLEKMYMNRKSQFDNSCHELDLFNNSVLGTPPPGF